ncbi:MAG: hypothetical protein JXQ73_28510 [Phycisphaerae bacterium]|nr:hypothetical protein [Phycisphaerae bacterium]
MNRLPALILLVGCFVLFAAFASGCADTTSGVSMEPRAEYASYDSQGHPWESSSYGYNPDAVEFWP